jgi:hypothetical protein
MAERASAPTATAVSKLSLISLLHVFDVQERLRVSGIDLGMRAMLASEVAQA